MKGVEFIDVCSPYADDEYILWEDIPEEIRKALRDDYVVVNLHK